MKTINLFIDTEFTNFETLEIISIGLVKDKNTYFYKESTSYKENNCSDFVIDNILPLLEKGNTASPLPQFKIELNRWIESLDAEIIIIGDYWGDWTILKSLINKITPVIGFVNMNDFFLREAKKKTFTANPKIVQQEYDILIDLFNTFTKKWYNQNQKTAHHALSDALANHYGFEHIINFINS